MICSEGEDFLCQHTILKAKNHWLTSLCRYTWFAALPDSKEEFPVGSQGINYQNNRDDINAAKVMKKRIGNTTALRRRRSILSEEEKEEAKRKNTISRRRHRALLSAEGSASVKNKDIASMYRHWQLLLQCHPSAHVESTHTCICRPKKKASRNDGRGTCCRKSEKRFR